MAVTVGAERHLRVVDVQAAQAVEPHLGVEARRPLRRACWASGSRTPRPAGGSSRGRHQGACRLPLRRSARRARRSCGRAGPACRRCSRAAAGSAQSSRAPPGSPCPRVHRRPVRLSLPRPGVQDNPGSADAIADPQRVPQRSQRLSPDLTLLAGAIDQVDGVDHDGLERRVGHRLPKRFEVLVGVSGRPPHPRALMEDLDRIAIALDPALDGVCQPTCCGNMRADQHDE